MKKLLAGLLALTMQLALCACSSKTATGEKTPPVETPAVQTETPAQETPDASPAASSVECTLFLLNDDGIVGVEEKTVTVENNAQSVMDALMENGAAPEGTRVNRAEVDGKTLKLDLSKAFGDAVKRTGTAGETAYLANLVDTFLVFYDCDQLVLTIEGQTLETGHQVYDQPIEMYLFD